MAGGEHPGGLLPGEPGSIPEIAEPEAPDVRVSAHHASCRPHPVCTGGWSTAPFLVKDDNDKIISQCFRPCPGPSARPKLWGQPRSRSPCGVLASYPISVSSREKRTQNTSYLGRPVPEHMSWDP